MKRSLLTDPNIHPTSEVLKNALGESYIAFDELSTILINKFNLSLDWIYYKYNGCQDWFCKSTFKKKTIFWLSVWEQYFIVRFYFLENQLEGIAKLGTNENSFILEKEFGPAFKNGKTVPLVFKVYSNEQFADLLKIVEYKMTYK